MADKYPPGGVMFYEERKKNERAPDLKGHIEVDQAMLDRLQAVIRRVLTVAPRSTSAHGGRQAIPARIS